MIVDLFAGPGGWELGAADLGVDTVGLELDPAVCATRSYAGWPTINTDLNTYPPARNLDGLIASPPCPAFSDAGLGHGRADIDRLTRQVLNGDSDVSGTWNHPDSVLMLTPLRWIHAGRPRWVVMEQVPPALPVWQAYRHRLELDGYSAWTGILNAADYGVPQTRRRAILVASLDRRVSCPPSTHTELPAESLFDPLEPWISAGSALDAVGLWPPGASRPAERWNLGFDRRDDLDGPTGYRERDRRPETSPAHTITEKARSSTWTLGERRRPRALIRTGDEPSPTILGNIGNSCNWYWERPATTVTDAIRLTEPEGLVLQGFPPDYPITALSQTARWQQIGNAIPPPVALAALQEVTR